MCLQKIVLFLQLPGIDPLLLVAAQNDIGRVNRYVIGEKRYISYPAGKWIKYNFFGIDGGILPSDIFYGFCCTRIAQKDDVKRETGLLR